MAKVENQRARRAAARVGLRAKKTRWRANSIDNFGGFAFVSLPSPFSWCAGSRFDMTAEEVVAWCKDSGASR